MFLDAQPEQKQLNQYHSGLWFWAPEDRDAELKRLKEKLKNKTAVKIALATSA